MWIYAVIGVSIILIYLFDSGQGPVSVDWRFFQNELLLKKEVQKLNVVNGQYAEIYLKPEMLEQPKHQKNFSKGFGALSKAGPHYTMTIGSNDLFMKKLDDAQTGLAETDKVYPEFVSKRTFGDTLYILLPLVVLVIIYFVIFRRMSGGGSGGGGTNIFNVGKSKARIFDKDENIRLLTLRMWPDWKKPKWR